MPAVLCFSVSSAQFFFGTADITGTLSLPKGVEMVMPGDNARLQVELLTDAVVEKGMRFAIREGGRTVGAGVVTNLISRLGGDKKADMGSSKKKKEGDKKEGEAGAADAAAPPKAD